MINKEKLIQTLLIAVIAAFMANIIFWFHSNMLKKDSNQQTPLLEITNPLLKEKKTITINNINIPEDENITIDGINIPANINLIVKDIDIPESSILKINTISLPHKSTVMFDEVKLENKKNLEIGTTHSTGTSRIVNNYFDIRGKQLRILEEKNPDARLINLIVRKSVPAGSDNDQNTRTEKLTQCVIEDVTEKDNTKSFEEIELDASRTALILIDVWDCHYNKGWLNRAEKVTKDKITRLLELARKNDIPVIHIAYNTKISRHITPEKDELVSTNLEEIIHYLQQKNITTLFYAGFSTNYCLLFRPAGMVNMKQNYYYDVIAVRDATNAFELPETLEKEYTKEVSLDIIEFMLGSSTTIKDLETALKYAKKPANNE